MKKRRAATPLEKLKKRPLLEVIGQKMIPRLAARIPVSDQPLHKPFDRVFCICRKPRDVSDMLGCEKCDEWYPPRRAALCEKRRRCGTSNRPPARLGSCRSCH